MTVLEVIRKSAEFLTRHGVESARLQIELMLSHVLSMPRLNLYLQFERILNEGEVTKLREMVQRRSKREPLQQILGTTSFCGVEIAVSPAVLIPRPETELLAERAWTWLCALSPDGKAALQALDLCTGSGCLAIAIALNCPAARVFATDLSNEALEVARGNASKQSCGDRVVFSQGDLFAALPGDMRFDLIVANPPYVPTATISGLDPEVRDFDPRMALDGGEDGLMFYRRLAAEAGRWLAPGRCMMLEFGEDQSLEIRRILESENWIVTAVESDYNQRERFLVASYR